MIRLTTRLAQKACSRVQADFSQVGWSKLKQAIGVRNRLVHPKSTNDLSISSDDVLTVKAGFFWLLGLVIGAMETINDELEMFNADARQLLDRLKSGDEEALAAYRDAIAND